MNTSSARDRTSFASIDLQIQHSRRSNHEGAEEDGPRRIDIADARDHVFQLGALAGKACTLFLATPRDATEPTVRLSPADNPFWREPSAERAAVAQQLGELFLHMFALAGVCGLDLCESILKKVELNGKKYPVELCKGKSGKYTNYSQQTGITPTAGQCTVNTPTKASRHALEDTCTVEGITVLIRTFANERAWNRYHTPRNIALALLGEVGEVAELFQWRGDGEGTIALDEEEQDKIGQEVADVTIYLLRLADVCHVALGEIALQLLEAESQT